MNILCMQGYSSYAEDKQENLKRFFHLLVLWETQKANFKYNRFAIKMKQ